MLNKSLWRVGVVVVLLVMASLACEFSFSSANIGDTYMASDEDGNNKTTEFTPADDWYAFVELKNAPDDTILKAKWYAVEVPGFDTNEELGEYEIEGGDGTYTFSYTPDGMVPAGKYKVEIYLNDERDKTLNFEVVAE